MSKHYFHGKPLDSECFYGFHQQCKGCNCSCHDPAKDNMFEVQDLFVVTKMNPKSNKNGLHYVAIDDSFGGYPWWASGLPSATLFTKKQWSEYETHFKEEFQGAEMRPIILGEPVVVNVVRMQISIDSDDCGKGICIKCNQEVVTTMGGWVHTVTSKQECHGISQ